MHNVLTIARRELGSLFGSPIAYVTIVAFLVFCAIYLFFVVDFLELNQASLRPLFEVMPVLFILILPAVAMGLVSEEKQSGTFELLSTLPVTDTQIIVGKYLGALVFLVVALLSTLIFPLLVGFLGDQDNGLVWGGYLGIFFVGAAYLAIGLMASTWTRYQIVAFVVALSICGAFYFVDGFLGLFSEGLKDGFAFLSFKAHFDSIARGVLDSRDIIFYLSFVVVCMVVSVQSLQARNWK
jgi:ABC-2 type transport system permease protein